MIYEKDGMVGADMIDAETNLSVIAVLRLVENGVTELMGKLKIDGITAKKLYNAMWVFTKNSVAMPKPLAWGQSFRAESFITAYSPAKLVIETAIKNTGGEIAAYAATELCALDLQTGRIRKTTTVGLDESFEKHPSLADIKFEKLGASVSEQVDEVTVRSSDIDFCRHTNNVEYVRFVLNTYSVEELLSKPVKRIDINHVNQSFENDKLQIYKSSEGGKDVFEIRKGETCVFRCAIVR